MQDIDKYTDLVEKLVEQTQAIGKLLEPGYGAHHLETLLAAYRWGLAQQPLAIGDKVRVTQDGLEYSQTNDYRHWMKHITEIGTVEEIGFSGRGGVWFAYVRFPTDAGLFSFRMIHLKKEMS